MDRTEIVHALAAMTEAEYQDLITEARGVTPEVRKELAARAVRGYRGYRD